MANPNITISTESPRVDLLHFAVGILVLTFGALFSILAVQFLLFW